MSKMSKKQLALTEASTHAMTPITGLHNETDTYSTRKCTNGSRYFSGLYHCPVPSGGLGQDLNRLE
jgi:hypothetical protein